MNAAASYDLDSLRAMAPRVLVADFRCEEGWEVPSLSWRGVPLCDLIGRAGPLPAARTVAVGAGTFVTVLGLEELSEDTPLLAFELNDAPLAREYGGPLRLVLADGKCFQSVKWVDRLIVSVNAELETARDLVRARQTGDEGAAMANNLPRNLS